MNREWNEVDIDWDSPPCTPDCPCPLCQQADRDEAVMLARLNDADAEMIDLGALAIACRTRPSVVGE